MESCDMCKCFTYEKSLKNAENYKLCTSCYSYYNSDNEFIAEIWAKMKESLTKGKR